MKKHLQILATSFIFSNALSISGTLANDHFFRDLEKDEKAKLHCRNFCDHCRYSKELDSKDMELLSIQAKHNGIDTFRDVKHDQQSLMNVGMLYYHGDYGIEKNYKKAHLFLSHQVHCKGTEGNYFLGLMYLNGQGVAKDNKKALDFLQKADGTRYSHLANYQLGLMHYQGMLAAPEQAYLLRDKTEGYFKEAIKSGHLESVYYLGMLYYNEAGNQEKYYQSRYIEACRPCFEIAAIAGKHSEAYFQLGKIFRDYSNEGDYYNRDIRANFEKFLEEPFSFWKHKSRSMEEEYKNLKKMTPLQVFQKAVELGSIDAASVIIKMHSEGKATLTQEEVRRYALIGNLPKLMVFNTFLKGENFIMDVEPIIVNNLV